MNHKVLMIGNGINRLSKNYSWDFLVNDLIQKFTDTKIQKRNKPFTYLYEEVLSYSIWSQRIKSEDELLNYISENVKNIVPVKEHELILNKYNEIITTNYDYLIEQQLSDASLQMKCDTKESRYSLFRVFNSNAIKVWHIHGEANKPKSLCLGFEHYSGYLQNIRNYLTTGIYDYHKMNLKELVKNDNIEISTWVDHFFFSDIDIIGLNLDFVETDIWWILIYRGRLLNSLKISKRNTITYYMMKMKYNETELSRMELMKANFVEVVEIPATNYQDYYSSLLK